MTGLQVAAIFLAVATVFASEAHADTFYRRDGQTLQGKILSETDTTMTVQTSQTEPVVLDKRDILNREINTFVAHEVETYQSSADMFEHFHKYGNEAAGFEYSGPGGWYGINQRFSADGQPTLPLPAEAVAVWGKYTNEEQKNKSFNPLIEVQLHPQPQGKSLSSMEYLKNFIHEHALADLPSATKEVPVGDKKWAVYQYKLPVLSGKVDEKAVLRKLCILDYNHYIIFIQLSSVDSEFQDDAAEFDETIAGIKFLGD